MYFVKVSTRWYFSTLHKSFREVLKAFLQSTCIKSSSPISSRHVALSQKETNWLKMTCLWQIYVESCLPSHHFSNTLFVPVLFQEFICLVYSPVLSILPLFLLEMECSNFFSFPEFELLLVHFYTWFLIASTYFSQLPKFSTSLRIILERILSLHLSACFLQCVLKWVPIAIRIN